jgi:hypothetical protein
MNFRDHLTETLALLNEQERAPTPSERAEHYRLIERQIARELVREKQAPLPLGEAA